jgi:Leucine-rich repeat (LRR) protein
LDNQLLLLLALDGANQLSALDLCGTQLLDDYLPTVAVCTSLHTLNLSQNQGITVAGLSAALPGFAAQLQRLDLRGTGVVNAVLPLLRHLPQLQQLVLADTAISWESKAGSAHEEGAAPMHAAAAAAPPGLTHLGALPDGRAAHAADTPVSQHRSSRQPAAGWPKLQMLDVTGTQLTDAGCVELAAEFVAAAAVAAEAGSGGLRVLHIGSSSHKLGRKAMLAVARLATLQLLTLQVRMLRCAHL